MLSLNLSVKIGLGYLNGGAGFFLWGFPWIEFWWWWWSAIGWKVERFWRWGCELLVLTIPVPSPMKRFWKYLQGDLHMALVWGQEYWERQETNSLSHSHSSWLHRPPPPRSPTTGTCWLALSTWGSLTYHSKEPRHYISTCKGRSRGGCTGGTCRRWWCSTSLQVTSYTGSS